MFLRNKFHSDLRIHRPCLFIPSSIGNQDSCVRGSLHLQLDRNILLKGISIKLVGNLKIPRDDTFTASIQGGVTFEHTEILATSRTSTCFELPAGTYDFPFELPLEERMMESVIGPGHEYHSYQVQATLHRRFAGDIRLSRPIKIYRSLSLQQIDLMNLFSLSTEGRVSETLHYRVSIPCEDIPFGSSFPVDFSFTSNGKDLKPGPITLRVLENHKLRVALTAAETVRYNTLNYHTYKEHTIFDRVYDEHEYSIAESDLLDTEWSTSKPVHLPQDSQACTQSVYSKLIKVQHTLAFEVDLKDSLGKVTRIAGTISVNIYMSPYSVMESGIVYRQNFHELKQEGQAPPSYGNHLSDSKFEPICL